MENNSREHKLTYGSLWRYHDETKTSLALCLSEFIDNSLASWLSGDRSKRLKINIQYHNLGKRNNFYIITDNANGMSKDELDNAMVQYNQTFNKDNSSLNQYGIGMKFGIFWIGQDADIYSKTPNGRLVVGKYNSIDKQPSDIVVSNVDYLDDEYIKIDSQEYELQQGTIIYIKNVYGRNRTMTNGKFAEVSEFLGYRFAEYLLNDSLEISIDTFEANGRQDYSASGIVKPSSISSDPSSILRFSNLVPDPIKRQEIIEKNKVEIEKIDEEINKLLEIKFRMPSQNYQLSRKMFIKKVYEMFFEDKKMEFEDTLTIIDKDNLLNQTEDQIYFEKITAKMKVMILASADNRKKGLAIKHKGRFIYHPSTSTATENIVNNYPMADDRYEGGVHKWLTAELALEDIKTNENSKYIKPDKNKSEIVFVDELSLENNYQISNDESISFRLLTKENFDKNLKEFLKDYIDFLKMVKEINQAKNQTDQTKVSIKNNIQNQQFANDVEYDENKDLINIGMKKFKKLNEFAFGLNNDSDKKVSVKLVDDQDSDWLIRMDSDEDENHIVYLFNRNNTFFQPDKNDSRSMQINYAMLLVYLDAMFKHQDGFDGFESVNEAINELLRLKIESEDE